MQKIIPITVLTFSLFITGCNDGKNGSTGQSGNDRQDGLTSLIKHTVLEIGNSNCAHGGLRVDSGLDNNRNTVLDDDEVLDTHFVCSQIAEKYFKRIATFPSCLQLDENCDTNEKSAVKMAVASSDGNTVFYTDTKQNAFASFNLTDAKKPSAIGLTPINGLPASIDIFDDNLFIAVDKSDDDTQSGSLDIYNVADERNPNLLTSTSLGGQPAGIDISPDGKFTAITIENQRIDENEPFPQPSAGELIVIKNAGSTDNTHFRRVSLNGLAEFYPNDPEPKTVSINDENIAAVTLQENNHIVLIDLETATILNHFSAGKVDLAGVDKTEDDIISPIESILKIPSEPDGIHWLNNDFFATANEGDFQGGSRSFSLFNRQGKLVYNSANELEHFAIRFGHYPEYRSENAGIEPERLKSAIFGDNHYLFISSERASLIYVYDVSDPDSPKYKQVLPAGVEPEGILTIEDRGLLVVSSEKDSRKNKIRSGLSIYKYHSDKNYYPTLQSANDSSGKPIAWGSLSGLSASDVEKTLYTVADSAYNRNRILKIDSGKVPAEITAQFIIRDSNDIIKQLDAVQVSDNSETNSDARKNIFDTRDRALLFNEDDSVNLDLEGIAFEPENGFWVVSEGQGTVGDDDDPVMKPNLLLKLDEDAIITKAIRLPEIMDGAQNDFGFTGVTLNSQDVFVSLQRPWNDEQHARIGIFNIATESWTFIRYPLEEARSQNGGWVGIGDITCLADNKLLVLERDNQAGLDASIKKLFLIDLTDVVDDQLMAKTFIKDLLPSMSLVENHALEKIEGLAVTPAGDVYIVNDNDGVDDNSGETQLLNLGKIL
ncbi:alkaline phosphatase [Shewanella sp. OPT22]|nr:alkaline phosphatase [Shewanella sp. OPT22]